MCSYPYIYDQKITEYVYDKTHPILEIIRHKFLIKVFDDFYRITRKYNRRIIKPKTNDFITRFVWKNISDIDPVIPYRSDNDYNYTQLKIDLTNYKCNADSIISELDLENKFKKFMSLFDKLYKEYDFSSKTKIKVDAEEKQLIYKNKYKVKYNDVILKKLVKFYNGNLEDRKNIIFCLLYRYSYLDAENQQLAINLDFKEDLRVNFGVDIEMFGSSINRYYNRYCSLFYDVERYFGSLGNIENIFNIQSGIFMGNPPYDEQIMENFANKIIDALKNTSLPLAFIVTVPVWNRHTSEIISKECNSKISNFPTYKCKEILASSPYLYKEYVFCARDFGYYNFFMQKYIFASNTYIFIVKNDIFKFDIELFEKLLVKHKLKRVKLNI